MTEIHVETWAKFEAVAMAKLQRMADIGSESPYPMDPVLFRGQGESQWGLLPTLQRAMIQSECTSAAYHRWMQIVHEDIASILGKEWNLDGVLNLGGFEVRGIEFMVYLRQNGFPSPLLDWTRSPYIASYLAFCDTRPHVERSGCVSIYTCEERPIEAEYERPESGETDSPSMHTIGGCLTTDQKHHLQQCQYSICLRGERHDCSFADYPDEVIECNTRPCILEKYTIPLSQQKEVLKRLQLMNITAFSLFGTEAALVESLAIREMFLELELANLG